MVEPAISAVLSNPFLVSVSLKNVAGPKAKAVPEELRFKMVLHRYPFLANMTYRSTP